MKPSKKDLAKVASIRLNNADRKKLDAIKRKLGIINTTDLVRQLLAGKYYELFETTESKAGANN